METDMVMMPTMEIVHSFVSVAESSCRCFDSRLPILSILQNADITQDSSISHTFYLIAIRLNSVMNDLNLFLLPFHKHLPSSTVFSTSSLITKLSIILLTIHFITKTANIPLPFYNSNPNNLFNTSIQRSHRGVAVWTTV